MAASDLPAEGLTSVFVRFRDRLARAVSRIVQPNDVEDIVQETFLRCYQASAKSTIRHPRSFMLTTAKNLALNHIAKADNRLVRGVASVEDSAVPLYRDAPSGSEPEIRMEFQLLCRAVRTLPLQCRRAFILKKVYGLSRKEIAEYMGIAESTVQKHVAKGALICAGYLEGLDELPARAAPPSAAPAPLRRKGDR
jgi:RNA polymerase sigma-70 factor (ECF subfamily)